MSLASKTIDSPVGKLKLVASEKGLVAILWENDDPERVRFGEPVKSEINHVLVQTERQLAEYFAGKRRSITVPLDLRGTPFQMNVWGALLAIPFGETRSYGELARRLGNPQAARAVGAATGKNPLSIVVPCHRLIGAAGKLTGFAGGLDAKMRLLELEQKKPGRHSEGQTPKRTHRAALLNRQNEPTLPADHGNFVHQKNDYGRCRDPGGQSVASEEVQGHACPAGASSY